MRQLREISLRALRKRRPWRVSGDSMVPDYLDGDLVLVDPASEISQGDAVVARHPFKNVEIIKYVAQIDDDDHVQLRSPQGDDSRQFGRVPRHTVRGRVTINVTAHRAGRNAVNR